MIRFARPEAFLLALPVLLLLRGRLATRPFVAVLRGLVLLLVLAALAEPWLPGAASGRDLIFVVDRSLSVAPEHDATVRETLAAAADRARPGDRAGVVTFGRDVAVEQTPVEGFRPADFAKAVDRDGSDLAAALDAALAAIPPERRGSIVVLSDGESTGRPAEDVARAAARRDVRVDVVPLRRVGAADLAVEELALPGDVGEREPFQWSAWIRSDRAVDAPVRLLRDGVVVGEAVRSLKPGMNRLVFRDRLAQAGVHKYEVEVVAPGDRVAENNRAVGVVRAEGTARYLAVTPGGREDRLTLTLRAAGLSVDVFAPEAAPFSPEKLDDYRAVLLENVPASRLPRGAMRALRGYVEDFGGGFLMTGGKASFGAGGYRKTDVEKVLPVTLEVRQEQRKFALAMSVPLDRSGSMAASAGPGLQKMDLANQGAIAAVERLGPTDSISVIAVDSSPHVVVPQSTVDAPDAMIAKIRRIESRGGGIFVGAALHAAADQLATAPQQNRHIVLFADAADAEEPTDYRTFVPALVQRGVTVSVIGLGTERDSDAQLLKEIATLGNGRCFFCADPSELPKVFAEETMQVARSTFSDEPTKIELKGELRALGDLALDAFPTAGGYSVAYARPEATIGGVTVDDARAPFFAFRQAGLGRSAAFLGEADGPASGGFATWDGYGTFFNTVVRWLGGSDAGGDVFADFVRDGHEAVLSVEVEAGKESALGKVVAKVAGPDGEAREVVLTRVGERRLEARVPMTGAGVYRAVVDAGENKPLRVAPLALPYSPEYATPPDPTSGERLLADLAAATLGRVDPPAAELFDGPRESQGFKDLASLCALLAVFMLLAEIAVRRLDVPFPTPRLPRRSAVASKRGARRAPRHGPPRRPSRPPQAEAARREAARAAVPAAAPRPHPLAPPKLPHPRRPPPPSPPNPPARRAFPTRSPKRSRRRSATAVSRPVRFLSPRASGFAPERRCSCPTGAAATSIFAARMSDCRGRPQVPRTGSPPIPMLPPMPSPRPADSPMPLRTSLAALVFACGAAAQAPYFEHVGTSDGQRSGLGVATLGDVNGDGVGDYAATDALGGAPRCVAYSGFDASVLWTYVGLPLPTVPFVTIYIPAPSVGAPLALGDVNGDGKGDVVFMDHQFALSWGATTNVLRCLSGVDGSVIWTASAGILGGLQLPGIPTLVGGGAADFDGDGVRDFVARSSNYNANYSDFYLASGATGGAIGSPYNYVGGSPSASVNAVLQDVSGDGLGDYAEAPGIGSMLGIYLGPSGAAAGALTNPSKVVYRVASIGDATGDGVSELAVSWRATFSSASVGDQTIVYLGGAGTVLYALTRGAAVGAGDDIVPLGDVDGDGFPDFASVGVSASGVRGYSVRSGPTGTALSTQFFASTGLGVATPESSVFAAPDVDLDGRPEIAVAEPHVDLGFTNNGRLRIQSFLPPPAAASLDLGGAAGYGGGLLAAAPPVLGTIVAVGATGAAASAAGLLVLDIGPPAVPTPLGGGALFLDLARSASWATFPVSTDAAGAFAFATPIPRIPLLAGLGATAQFAAFGTGAPLGFGLSTGVRVTFGL